MKFREIFEFPVDCPFLAQQVDIDHILYVVIPLVILFDESSGYFDNQVFMLLDIHIWNVEGRTLDFAS